MMKRCCVLLILLTVFFITGNAFAQTKRFELFVGYSPLRNYSGGYLEHIDTLHGWNTSLTTNIKPWIGITADFGGHYDGRYSVLSFSSLNGQFSLSYRAHRFMSHRGMVGPQVKLPNGRWEPFGHALYGVSRDSKEAMPPFTGGSHDTGSAWALGGGLDLKVSERVKIRLIQADYMRSKTSVGRENLRTSFGLVFRF